MYNFVFALIALWSSPSHWSFNNFHPGWANCFGGAVFCFIFHSSPTKNFKEIEKMFDQRVKHFLNSFKIISSQYHLLAQNVRIITVRVAFQVTQDFNKKKLFAINKQL